MGGLEWKYCEVKRNDEYRKAVLVANCEEDIHLYVACKEKDECIEVVGKDAVEKDEKDLKDMFQTIHDAGKYRSSQKGILYSNGCGGLTGQECETFKMPCGLSFTDPAYPGTKVCADL